MARRTLDPAQQAVVQAVLGSLDQAGPRVPDADGHPVSGLLVAVSGGSDSLALAAGAGEAARRRGLNCQAVSIDHGLQEGSRQFAQAAVDQVEAWGIPGRVVSVEVGTHGGLEAAARAARLTALESAASAGEWILLGHTLDDQAETVLLGLARGSGTRSLAGMRPQRGRFLRPLLGLRRTTVAEAAADWGAATHADRHNADRRFARVRARLDVLPVLEDALGPGTPEALARTADLARADADALDALAADVANPSDCGVIAALPQALRTRVIKMWLTSQGAVDLAHGHVLAVEELVVRWHGQKAVDVPGIRVVRRDGQLVAVRA